MQSTAKDRLVTAAYDLFAQHGVRAVGIDAILERADVARMTLYRHFKSKDELVLTTLQIREQVWMIDWLFTEVRARAASPRAQLLAIFDVLGEWCQRDDFEGCMFIRVMLESPAGSEARRACVGYLQKLGAYVVALATEAGIGEPGEFAHQWGLLIKGCAIARYEGDKRAPERARALGELLLAKLQPLAADQ